MTLERETKETRVRVTVARGDGPVSVSTSEPFLTHMMETLARYAGLSLTLEATGDLRHHLTEDVAITLGRAIRDIVPATCVRWGAIDDVGFLARNEKIKDALQSRMGGGALASLTRPTFSLGAPQCWTMV